MYTPVSLVLILVDSHMLIHDTLWGGGAKLLMKHGEPVP